MLRGCSVEVRPGEVIGVIGPNGAGKSTLVKAVFGLLRVRGGTVRLRGQDVTGRPAHELVRRGVGYVPQLQNVFPTLTVEENLRMGAYLRPRDHARRVTAVEELFPVLADRRKQKAGAMSGGERQMLAMARALMTESQLLLLDEPSAGLSPLHQDHVFDRCRTINSAGVAMLMIEPGKYEMWTFASIALLTALLPPGWSARVMPTVTRSPAAAGRLEGSRCRLPPGAITRHSPPPCRRGRPDAWPGEIGRAHV